MKNIYFILLIFILISSCSSQEMNKNEFHKDSDNMILSVYSKVSL